ncbi:hypothetical protein KVG88_30095 [Pseudomonas sp. SWRI74]|uniref:Uncharacterized protein n=1 Tax=Pseudomonas azerbaijanoccidentalis TaxID=2842347 RepID=A0ABS6QZG1_9PSED|nr:hypothetical protein [Pseudomonas azerbaijanoccidentalis]MBV4524327.1 hypothetical protein [Pseudomonas azerbaijanoccidentalis]
MGNNGTIRAETPETSDKSRKKNDCKAMGGFAMGTIMVKSGHDASHLLSNWAMSHLNPTAESFEKKQA